MSKLIQDVEAVEIVNKLRAAARELHENTVLHHMADLMNDAADKITECIRKDIERG